MAVVGVIGSSFMVNDQYPVLMGGRMNCEAVCSGDRCLAADCAVRSFAG